MTKAVYEHSSDLLLRQQLSDRHVENLLAPVGFADWKNASRCLDRIAGHSVEARLALAEVCRHCS